MKGTNEKQTNKGNETDKSVKGSGHEQTGKRWARMSIIKHLKISRKIMLLNGIAVVFLALIGYAGIYYSGQLQQQSNTMYEDRLIPIHTLHEIRNMQGQIDAALLELLLAKEDQDQVAQLEEKITSMNNQMNTYFAELQQHKIRDELQGEIEDFKSIFTRYRAERGKVISTAFLTEQQLQLMKRETAYEYYVEKVVPIQRVVNEKLENMVRIHIEKAGQVKAFNEEERQQSFLVMIGCIGAAVLLFAMIGTVISSRIVKPLRSLQAQMKEVEQGDLRVSCDYDSRDEIGDLTRSFQEMMKGLRELVHHVDETSHMMNTHSAHLLSSAEETARGSQHIAQSTHALTSSMERQADMARFASNSMEEMNKGIQTIASHTEAVSELSYTASSASQSGLQDVQSIQEQMQAIERSSEGSEQSIRKLQQQSDHIHTMIQEITRIAAATNILSLNAAIEASRAGEAGKGFAVVAQEIRELADHSKRTAGQIVEVVAHIHQEALSAVHAIGEDRVRIQEGVVQTERASASFQHIQSSVVQVRDKVLEVSALVEQLTASSEGIVESARQTAEISETAAGSCEEIAASNEEQLQSMQQVKQASHHLAETAQQLRKLVSAFDLSS
ncbi:methyl-accepting chemotaxis protein [Marinicrinis sediminis]|uniref:Methyl-accepting chemotaxis protein n=1 Tax=Marinicrinis sediminis TaxID=1652465 RepID=A0ABW5RA98_9BACL